MSYYHRLQQCGLNYHNTQTSGIKVNLSMKCSRLFWELQQFIEDLLQYYVLPFLFNLLKIVLLYMYGCFACIFVYHVHAWCP